MDQGSSDWLQWRRTGIGASDAPIIMGVSPWKSIHQLWLEKTGRVKPGKQTWIMRKGHRMERKARSIFEMKNDRSYEPILAQHKDLPFIRASLDGWDEETKTAIEIKYSSKKDFERLRYDGTIPVKYYPQIQHQYFVTGADQVIYCAYNGEELISVMVEKNRAYIAELLDQELRFWRCVIDDVEPK